MEGLRKPTKKHSKDGQSLGQTVNMKWDLITLRKQQAKGPLQTTGHKIIKVTIRHFKQNDCNLVKRN
jgi:hypothetical protein